MLKRSLGLWPLLLLAAGPVMGQGASGESCAQIENEPRRLICYDLVFRVGSTALAPARQQAPGLPEQVPNWPMTSGPSRLGDGVAVAIATLSREPISEGDQMARMSIGCDDDRTSVTFNFSGYFISEANGGNVLKARVDGAAPMELVTIASESVMILFGGAKSIPFLKTLLDGEELHLTVKPTSGPEVQAEFSLEGIKRAIVPIQQACNWT